MKKICAWCNKELADSDSNDKKISHGICEECAKKIFSIPYQHSIQYYIDKINSPIVIIQDDTTIALANKRAQKIMQIKPAENRIGDLLECSCARLPGGCGKTIHCKACTIRNAVQRTRETGHNYYNIKAYQEVKTPTGPVKKEVEISTEKVWDTILVRIDTRNTTPVKHNNDSEHAPWQQSA